MKKRTSHRLILLLATLILLAAGWAVSGPPARDRVIEDTQIDVVANNVVLEVKLTFPFRYQSHFPLETGKELRIRIAPVRVPSADLSAIFQREGVVPPDAETAAIDEVIYEGDAPDGPYLTIRFTRPVHYTVIPSHDYRHLNIVIQGLIQ